MRIGFLGAYSIDNTGDRLLGYAVRQAFRARLPDAEQVLLAPAMHGGFWRHAWDAERGLGIPIERVPVDDGSKWAKGFDAIVIGGGGIVRLDPDFRPFLLGDPNRFRADARVAWNALGAEATPAYLANRAEDYRRVARCCEKLAYASVRNDLSARFVRRCGYRGDLHVVPDAAFTLDVPGDGTGEATLRAAGIDPDSFVVGVSPGTSVRDPRASHFYSELFGALAALAKKRAVEVVIFPFGEIYGDSEAARIAHRAIPGAKIVRAPLGPLETWRLVGALDLHVCSRYHAVVASIAQDVPFLVMDEYLGDETASSKIRELVVAEELEAFYLAPYLSLQPAAKLDNLLTIADEISFEARAVAMRARLAEHYDAMIAALRR